MDKDLKSDDFRDAARDVVLSKGIAADVGPWCSVTPLDSSGAFVDVSVWISTADAKRVKVEKEGARVASPADR